MRLTVRRKEPLPSEENDAPWEQEPDRFEFVRDGFPCLIRRAPLGVLCGYVGLPPTHWAYEVEYSDKALEHISVHGGLSYSDHCDGEICHVAENEVDHRWWLGFDCGHTGDIIPAAIHIMEREQTAWQQIFGDKKLRTYRTMEFVIEEVKKLVKQLRVSS